MELECSKCNEVLDTSKFYKDSSRPNGYHPYCKYCKRLEGIFYNRTPRGIVNAIYQAEKSNSISRKHPQPTYTLNQLYDWVMEQSNFYTLYNNWVNSGYIKDYKPSIDRLDNTKGYSFDNIRLVTWRENNEALIGEISLPVVKLSIDGHILNKYISINLAARENNLSPGHISKAVNNPRTKVTVGGYIWFFVDDYSMELITHKLKIIKDHRVVYHNEINNLIEVYPSIRKLHQKYKNNPDTCLYNKNIRSILHMCKSHNYKRIWSYRDSLKYLANACLAWRV